MSPANGARPGWPWVLLQASRWNTIVRDQQKPTQPDGLCGWTRDGVKVFQQIRPPCEGQTVDLCWFLVQSLGSSRPLRSRRRWASLGRTAAALAIGSLEL